MPFASALEGVKILAYVIIGLGLLNILALRFKDNHPAAQAWADIYGSGC